MIRIDCYPVQFVTFIIAGINHHGLAGTARELWMNGVLGLFFLDLLPLSLLPLWTSVSFGELVYHLNRPFQQWTLRWRLFILIVFTCLSEKWALSISTLFYDLQEIAGQFEQSDVWCLLVKKMLANFNTIFVSLPVKINHSFKIF